MIGPVQSHYHEGSTVRWEGFVEKVSFKPGVKKWRSDGWWKRGWWDIWVNKWMRRWIDQRFTISEVAANWHELMVQHRIMWPSTIRCDTVYVQSKLAGSLVDHTESNRKFKQKMRNKNKPTSPVQSNYPWRQSRGYRKFIKVGKICWKGRFRPWSEWVKE